MAKRKDTTMSYGNGSSRGGGGGLNAETNKRQKTGIESDDSTKSAEGNPTVRWILNCRNEAKLAKWNRVMQTRENWDVYWMRQDFSHKLEGQSRETLSMQAMAVEETAAFFQQALADAGNEWWDVDLAHPGNAHYMEVTTDMVKAITQLQLQKAEILKHVANSVKSGLLGSLMITKVHGDKYSVPKYVAVRGKGRTAELRKEEKYAWKLRLDVVSQFNYYPDPTPTNHKMLYEIEDMWMDYHEVVALSEGDDAIYDPEVVAQIEHSMDDDAEVQFDNMRRTNQNYVSHSFRGRVKITDFWGDILDDDDQLIHKNVVCTLANDRWLIRPPTPNPLWHQETPYVVAPLLDIPDAKWPKALMDAPSKHNVVATELFNLMVDGSMKAVNNVGMIRQSWLEDPTQVEGGIKPGINLGVNSQCPPGAKVLEMVQTGVVPPEAQQVFQIIQQEFNRAALTSDIRQGMQPRQDVSATQIVEANQTITSVFQGLSKNIETQGIQKILEKSWMTCCQYSDLMDEDELRSVLGPEDADTYLNMTPEERFANTVHGIKFRVSGISMKLQKSMDSKRYMMLLQTIGANPSLMEEFVKQGYSLGSLLEQIIKTMGIDTRAIQMDIAEKEVMNQNQQPQGQPGPSPQGPMQGPGAAQPGASPDMQSQVPQPQTGSLQDQLGSAAPGVQLPHEGFHRRG